MAIAPAPVPPTVEILEKLPEISLKTLLAKNKMPHAQLPMPNYQLPITNARCPMPHPSATLEPNSHLLLFGFFLSCQVPRPSSLKAQEFDTASQSAESGDLRSIEIGKHPPECPKLLIFCI